MHEGHKIVKIGDAVEGIQLDQRDVFDELKTATECAAEMCKDLRKRLENVNDNAIDIKKKIEATGKSLCNFISEKLTKLVKDIETERDETKENMECRIVKLEELIKTSSELIKCVEKKESGEGPYANLWNISEMIKMTSRLVAAEIERLEDVHFEYLLSVEAEEEKLKTLVDSFIVSKEVISIQPRYPIDFEKLSTLKSEQSKIKMSVSANSGSVYDQRRKIVVSVTGLNGEKKTNLMLTKFKENGRELVSEPKNIEGVIPFDSTNVYPVYDGIRYIYFVGIKDGMRNKFGRINIEKIEKGTFEELPSLPDKEKDAKRQFAFPSGGVYHFGKIYIQDSECKIWQFSISVSIIHLFYSFFISFPIYRTINGPNSRSNCRVTQAS